MAGRLSLIVGLGAGYVMGARSGRARYDQIASKAQRIWQDPRVRDKAGRAQHLMTDKAGSAGARIASTIGEKVGSGPKNDTGTGADR